MIKTSPKEAEKPSNYEKVRKQNFLNWSKVKKKKPKLKKGDFVRVSLQKDPFFRKFHQQFNEEVYKVKKVNTHLLKPLYTLEDFYGKELIEGEFYEYELTRIELTHKTFKVEKILEEKKRKKVKWCLVKFRGYSEPEWVKKSDIFAL